MALHIIVVLFHLHLIKREHGIICGYYFFYLYSLKKLKQTCQQSHQVQISQQLVNKLGFRGNASTTDQVHRITVGELQDSIPQSSSMGLRSSIRSGLVQKLNSLPTKQQLLQCYLPDKYFRIKKDDAYFELKKVRVGVPQGSV